MGMVTDPHTIWLKDLIFIPGDEVEAVKNLKDQAVARKRSSVCP